MGLNFSGTTLFRKMNNFNELRKNESILSTTFQQKMLKILFSTFLILFFLASCAYYPQKKVDDQIGLKIGMTEDEVKRILGEPTTISKTQEGTIIWSYKPSWKLIPDNRGTTIIEFRENRVIKVIKVR